MKLPISLSKTLPIGNITALLPIIDRMMSHENTITTHVFNHRSEMANIESQHHLSLADINTKHQIRMAELKNIDGNNMREHEHRGKLIDMMEKLIDTNDANVLEKMQLIGSVFLQSSFEKINQQNQIEQ